MKRQMPIATYRLQFSAQFTFQQAIKIVEYLQHLGISHCYSSPLMMANPGSTHGYDIVDHSKLNPEIGTIEEFETFIKTLHDHQMGLIFDIVPNHMHIVTPANHWWYDVLENGKSSPYAETFAIDWNPPQIELTNKVLLPFLEEQYGDALEKQALQVIYQEGAFLLKLTKMHLPTDPKSWLLILQPLAGQANKTLPVDDKHLLELQSIVTALKYLPSTVEADKEKIKERLREKEVIKKRLKKLMDESEKLASLLQQCVIQLNGKKGDSQSFNDLESFINDQPYRLCFWRVANDEINYRRFFDIFEYVGIHTEKPEVFESIHKLVFEFINKNLIDGLRIDHIDGLLDPEKYLQDLQDHCKQMLNDKDENFFIIVEKILMGNEKLRKWPVAGTVGYDFLNQVNGLFVFQSNKKALQEIYHNFTGVDVNPIDLVFSCKKIILVVSLSSELSMIARLLDHISEQHRSSRDFTAESLKNALRDVIACFPVYRSYIQEKKPCIQEEDRLYIQMAISRAKRLNPAINISIFDFIQSVLLLEHLNGINEQQMHEREDFVLRFQQLTGPAMAKGLEDTAFYRFHPLASLNEVGGDPYTFGTSESSFHKKNMERFEIWPHTLTATSTHDTKRSEDVRARINVLSEIPTEWETAIIHWNQINQVHKTKDDEDLLPDKNDEYLLYQTLVGSWPLYPMEPSAHIQYIKKIQGYMEKALKEAKVHTSWINPNKLYDQSMHQFIEKILHLNEHENLFITEFKKFIPKILSAGMLNSLSQLLLKLTSPGIPDIYQGNEIWDFSLVDPDNRKQIDYTNREYLLKGMIDKKEEQYLELLQQFIHHPEDGRLKLFITLKTLQIRKKLDQLFFEGSYRPLASQGDKKNNIVSFTRSIGNKTVIVIAGRFFTFLMNNDEPKIQSNIWQNTQLILPPELSKCKFRHLFTGELITPNHDEKQPILQLSEVLHVIPLALLESKEE